MVDDELLKSLDYAVAGDLDGAVSARVVPETDEVFAEVGAFRSLAEPQGPRYVEVGAGGGGRGC